MATELEITNYINLSRPIVVLLYANLKQKYKHDSIYNIFRHTNLSSLPYKKFKFHIKARNMKK